MTVRWRLAVLGTQLIALMLVSYTLTGRPVVGSTWFLAGLLGIVINPQLFEPYYPRPADVIGNAVIFLFVYFTVDKAVATPGWIFFAMVLPVFAALAVVALTFGAGRSTTPLQGVARAARQLSQIASARVIYSAIFVLSAIEYTRTLT